jgi:hypothetical protein
MIDNLSSRWTKQETDILEKNLENVDYDELCKLLPGRSKASIKAKLNRLFKSDPIPSKLKPAIFKYYLSGEAEGQILHRMRAAGHNYTLKDIAVVIKKARQEVEAIYAEEHTGRPTLDQLKEFIEKRNNG